MMWQRLAPLVATICTILSIPSTPAQAEFAEFQFGGVVDTVIDQNSSQDLLDLVGLPVVGTMDWVNVGTAGSISFSYDTAAGAPNPNQPNLGFYYDIAELTFQFNGVTITTNDTLVSVQNDLEFYYNDPTLYDAIEVEASIPGNLVSFPPGTTDPLNMAITVRLLSTDLTTFSDGYLPATLNLAKFDTRQFSIVGDNFVVGDPGSLNFEWLVGGTVVPEPSSVWLMFFGLASVGLILYRQRKMVRTP